jgi:hypothetical protein
VSFRPEGNGMIVVSDLSFRQRPTQNGAVPPSILAKQKLHLHPCLFLGLILSTGNYTPRAHQSHRSLRDGSRFYGKSRHFVPGYLHLTPPGCSIPVSLAFQWTCERPLKGHSLQIAFAAGAANRFAGCLSERILVKLLLFISPVPLGDPFPSLSGVIQRRFCLGLTRKHRRDTNIEFVPIFSSSRDT